MNMANDDILKKKKRTPWPPEPDLPDDVHEAELLKKKRKIAERDVGVPKEEQREDDEE